MAMNATKVVTGKVRLSYAHVWEPVSINDSKPKYSVSLVTRFYQRFETQVQCIFGNPEE